MSIITTIKKCIPHYYDVWMSPVYADDMCISDIFKVYYGTYKSVEKQAKKDLPNDYEIIDISIYERIAPKKHRPISVLIKSIYIPCLWRIYNRDYSVDSRVVGTAFRALKEVLKKKRLGIKMEIWADFNELEDPNWMPF